MIGLESVLNTLPKNVEIAYFDSSDKVKISVIRRQVSGRIKSFMHLTLAKNN